MAKTLVLYDGRSSSAERVAVTLGCIIGKVRIRELGEAPASPESFRNVLFVCNFYGALTASRTRDYISAHKEALSGCRIALVGVGFSDVGFVKYVGNLESMLQLSEPLTTVFLRNEKMTVGVGAHLSKVFGKAVRPLPAKALLESIEAFASAHSVMALATANEDYVRCTPVDYSYADGKFYIVTEGGMKFRSILRNDHVSLAIFESERHSDGLLDVLQVEGTVDVLPGDSPVAHREASARIQRGGMDSGEIFVLRVNPQHYHISSAAFVAWGYDAEQTLDAEQIEALYKKETAPSPANEASGEAAEENATASSEEQANAASGASLEVLAAEAAVSGQEFTEEDLEKELAEEEAEDASDVDEEEKKDENAAPDLMLGEGVDWLNFSVGDFDPADKEKASGSAAKSDDSTEEEDNFGGEEGSGFDESIRSAEEAGAFCEGLEAADGQNFDGTVGSEMEAAFAEDDVREDGEENAKELFADAEALAARELDADEAELFGEDDEAEKPKKRGFFANAKERFSKLRKKKGSKEEAAEESEELPKTMLSAQRKLSRKDETGPSRYVYNADEDDDLFDDYDEYDEFDEYD